MHACKLYYAHASVNDSRTNATTVRTARPFSLRWTEHQPQKTASSIVWLLNSNSPPLRLYPLGGTLSVSISVCHLFFCPLQQHAALTNKENVLPNRLSLFFPHLAKMFLCLVHIKIASTCYPYPLLSVISRHFNSFAHSHSSTSFPPPNK